MHELSIAEAVVAIVDRHAGGRTVRKVELKVGHLRQVVPDALTFAFELLTAGHDDSRAPSWRSRRSRRRAAAARAAPRRR